jgi:sugar phosphate isomerase/epimerase
MPRGALAVTHLTALDLPPVALVEAAAAAGLEAVCLRTSPAVPGGAAYPLAEAAERRALLAAVEATGVRVLAVEQVGLHAGLDVRACEPLAEIAAGLGATALAVAGDSDDLALVADRLAALAELVRPFGLVVELEFMPFRAVRTLADAAEVVTRAAAPDARIVVDALHLHRSGGVPADLAALDPALLGPLHLCDAPLAHPPGDALATEARTGRRVPGHGAMPLRAMLDAMPPTADIVLEVPVAGAYPGLDPAPAIARLADETRAFLAAGGGEG